MYACRPANGRWHLKGLREFIVSLINLILSQKIIIISLGLAGLLMFLAVMLTLVGRLRKFNAKRAQLRAERKAEQEAERQAMLAFRAAQAEQAADDESEDENDEPAARPSRAAAPRAKGSAKPAAVAAEDTDQPPVKTVAAAPKAAPKPPVVKAPAPPPPTPAPAPATQPEAGPSAEMQNILASVFVDDELMARYDVLLRGLEVPSVSELLALCQDVAGQLGAGRMPAPANKEHQ